MPFDIKSVFERDRARIDGVRWINVHLMQVLYFLMAVFLVKDALTYILSHQDPREPREAMVWSV